MRVALFFICLCYLLFGGYNYLYTGGYEQGYPTKLRIEKNHGKFLGTHRNNTSVKTSHPQPAVTYFFENMEEENDDEPYARRFKTLTASFYAFLSALDGTLSHNQAITLRPYSRLLANKYITQRVMRI